MLHSQHLHRPTFDESSEEEKLIESCTTEITLLFNSIHRNVQFIKSHTFEGNIGLNIPVNAITFKIL